MYYFLLDYDSYQQHGTVREDLHNFNCSYYHRANNTELDIDELSTWVPLTKQLN